MCSARLPRVTLCQFDMQRQVHWTHIKTLNCKYNTSAPQWSVDDGAVKEYLSLRNWVWHA
eukprot:m.153710 g.153710  ORF g.153710 m.153710 type:complete len:60 (+) comp23466_c0_seq3:3287-3466(+)